VAQIAAGLGVILVVIQVWQGVSNSRVGVVTGLTTLISDVDRVFLDLPELWKYFNDSMPTPPQGDEESERCA